MKKLLLPLSAVLLLSGCTFNIPYIKLEQRVIVQALGVDYEKGNYTVTMQYSTSEKPDATGGGTVKTIKGEGPNIYDAVKKARDSEGEYLFFMQNQIVLLGLSVIQNNLAVETVREYLEYCDRLPDAVVAGCYGKAEEVISFKAEEKHPTRNKFYVVMNNAEKAGVFPNEKIYEAMSSSMNKNGSLYIPMLKLEDAKIAGEGSGDKPESGNSEDKKGSGGAAEEGGGENGGGGGGGGENGSKKLTPSGAALVMGGNFVTFLDEDASSGLTLLLNRAYNACVNFELDGTVYTIEMYKIKARIKPYWDGKELTFRIIVTATADRAYNRLLFEKEDRLADFDKAAEAALIELLEKAVAQSAVEHGADIIKLEENLRHYDCRRWLKAEENWTDELKKAKYTFHVNVKLQ